MPSNPFARRSTKSIKDLVEVSSGRKQADLSIENAKIVNVYSGEIIEGNIAVYQDRIAGVGPRYKAAKKINLKGRYIAPGFIDGHFHIESSLVTIPELARVIVPRGTTSVIADPHEITNVLGYDGIRFMLESSKHNPLNVFFTLPSCVPATDLETSGSSMRAFDIYPFFREKWVVGLGEVMNYPGVLGGDDDVIEKIAITEGKRIDGHAPGVTGKDLAAYISTGIASDHESTTPEEAREKLRLGMYVMIREGSAAKNLESLLPLVNQTNKSRFLFVTDDHNPSDILASGHIDGVIRKAIKLGMDPITAIQLATLNAAEYFGLKDIGAIAPGMLADLVIFDNLKQMNVTEVFKSGAQVGKRNKPIYEDVPRPNPIIRSTVNIKWLEGDEFHIPAEGGRCRVIGIVPNQIVTDHKILKPKLNGREVIADTKRDILKVYVLERHTASGRIGKGLVQGLGIKKGAVATSIAHDSHNIIAAGCDDQDIFKAVTHINKIGGGMVAVADGEILADVKLPIAGLMSDRPMKDVADDMGKLTKVIHDLGSKLEEPVMTLSFLALPVIPELKLTDHGLIDVKHFKPVNLFTK
ncbi:MAG: adenine deaminase [candidate division Zixibacteria bacterium]|nr:adenine deaminase [candidate division Zixibacteria bacterium]